MVSELKTLIIFNAYKQMTNYLQAVKTMIYVRTQLVFGHTFEQYAQLLDICIYSNPKIHSQEKSRYSEKDISYSNFRICKHFAPSNSFTLLVQYLVTHKITFQRQCKIHFCHMCETFSFFTLSNGYFFYPFVDKSPSFPQSLFQKFYYI